ncbi:MAG: ADP compounds hydrolase NudE [Oceanospirillaceae bacterium]|nr:ADP compounds hydrolase NudE [Oceanospirillaceae bacterium]MBT13367.1 ADP compounds hydrolase NudE [Oceanospirillaceae bacterium]|tara:strand:- start:13392 stop:13961 length:570 start_codon:yes stop_codon:yes gene_type:complete
MHKKPQILERHIVAQSRLFRVESFDLRFSNGVERTYERLVPGGNGAVMLVALMDDDTIALIREYGGGIEDYTLTLPKGAIDMGESLRDACNRELQEEIGFAAREFIFLKKLSLSPSYMSGGISVVVARDLYESRLEGDEPEPLELIPWKLDDLAQLYGREDFTEGRALAAITLAQAYLAGDYQGEVLTS